MVQIIITIIITIVIYRLGVYDGLKIYKPKEEQPLTSLLTEEPEEEEEEEKTISDMVQELMGYDPYAIKEDK